MSKLIDEELWLEDPCALFSLYLIPDSLMTQKAKINALTRMAIIIFIVMWLSGIKYSSIFLILSILFILLLYYKKMNKEKFSNLPNQTTNMANITKTAINPTTLPRQDMWLQKVKGYDMLSQHDHKRYGNINQVCHASNYAYDKQQVPYSANSYVNATEQTQNVCGLLQDNGVARPKIPYNELKKVSSLHKTDVGIDFFAPPIQIQERSLIPPLIVPRIMDKEVWSPTDFNANKKVNRENWKDMTELMGSDKFCPQKEPIVNVRMSSSSIGDPTKIQEYSQDFPVISDYANLPTEVKVYSDVQPYRDGVILPASRQPINGNYGISEIPNWDMSSEKKYYVNEAGQFENLAELLKNERQQNTAKNSIEDKASQPFYDRYDPQLIRDYGPEGRQAEMPARAMWSTRVTPYEARNPPDFNSVFDPRFSGYGDPFRSYLDADKGNIAYYYGDVDAYRHPVFLTRSKVDFIEQRQPMGKIWPLYNRDKNMCLDEAIEQAQNRWFTDTTQFREGLMASQMNKRNAESWQQRYAPISLRPT